ncbi:MAG TPA: hypothetical protein PLC27_04870 [Saprospiraceae bacterium]|nr:hypothetical protein [Saprospiraceae bacterium]HRG40709.1 hypothetical protein [Saprospiraceae bacterium]
MVRQKWKGMSEVDFQMLSRERTDDELTRRDSDAKESSKSLPPREIERR